MINIKFNPKTFTLDITGHAEHGKKGEDIVCSAIYIGRVLVQFQAYDGRRHCI